MFHNVRNSASVPLVLVINFIEHERDARANKFRSNANKHCIFRSTD